jgi:hypothetical protein
VTSSNQANPHLTDIFRTALGSKDLGLEEPIPDKTPKIVVHGNNNVIAFGGHVVIYMTASDRS